jgi:hypothetical protein
MLLTFVIVSGCKKTDFDNTPKGEALGTFTLSAPENNAMLVLNSGTPDAKINITWTAAKPGLSATPIYKFIAALKTGSLEQPLIEIPADDNGKSTHLTLTQKQLLMA